MKLTVFRTALAGALALLACSQAMAATAVIPTANTSRAGTANANFLGPAGGNDSTFQIEYTAAALTAVPIGSIISAIGFRLYPRYPVTTKVDYSTFDVQVGGATNTPATLDRTYANNQAADTIMARSGTLSFAAGAMIGNRSVNPFFTVDFTTPYTYTGGSLVFTIRDVLAASSAGTVIPLDAIDPRNSGGTIGSVTGGANSPSGGTPNVAYAPIMQLTFSTPVPEPASWALMIAGFGMVGGVLRRQRNPALA